MAKIQHKPEVPYAKCSTKEKKRRDAARRGTWYGVNPVTRRSPNPKAYSRAKFKNYDGE